MISDSLLAFGLLLSTATQLRIGDTPFGPGEMCLAVWLGLHLYPQAGGQASGAAPISNAALSRVATFWLILIVAESIGAIVGFATELFFDTAHIIHDVIAYSFLFVLACVMALDLANQPRRRRVTWLIVLLGAASLSLQVVHAYGLIRLPLPVEPWFYDRLRGWSNDPNQLGLVAAFLTLLSIHLAETATARVGMIAAAACAAVALSVGVLSKSDSFTLGILTAGAVFLAVKSSAWLATPERDMSLRVASVGIALFALPLVVVAALPFAPVALERGEAKYEALYNEDSQGDLRFHLWAEAIEKGMNAAMLGLGPGPHLTKKVWKRAPPAKFEAHNTPLDLFVQGGLLALLALGWLYASLVWTTVRARLPALAALSCGFVVFSMFHFIIRHPIFWMGVVLCFLEAAPASKLVFVGRQRMKLGYDSRIS
jgi:O-Antigen ligase